MNLYQQQPFSSFNTDVDTRRGGYRAGTIGVSNIQGKTLNYNAPALNPLKMGAGVSTMRQRPVSANLLQPETYSLYKQEPVSAAFSNFYKK